MGSLHSSGSTQSANVARISSRDSLCSVSACSAKNGGSNADDGAAAGAPAPAPGAAEGGGTRMSPNRCWQPRQTTAAKAASGDVAAEAAAAAASGPSAAAAVATAAAGSRSTGSTPTLATMSPHSGHVIASAAVAKRAATSDNGGAAAAADAATLSSPPTARWARFCFGTASDDATGTGALSLRAVRRTLCTVSAKPDVRCAKNPCARPAMLSRSGRMVVKDGNATLSTI